MSITRNEKFKYVSRNAETGLTNVVAKVRRNGIYVLGTDTTPLPLTEIDNGQYELTLTASQLNLAGGAGYYDLYINSATRNAPAISSRYVTEKDNDELFTKIDGVETKIDSVQADTNAIQSDLTSVKATVEDTNTEVKSPIHGLGQLKTLVDMIQSTVSNISNVARFAAFMPSNMIRPSAGNRRYRVEMRLFDTNGNMEDPDGNITVGVKDEAGNSRNAYLVGSVAGAAVAAARASLGVFSVDVDLPSTADLEQLIFNFDYAENAIPFSQVGTTQVIEEIQASGLALEATSQEILLDTSDVQPRVVDIQAKVNDANIGLGALKALMLTIENYVNTNNDILSNATYGLSALQVELATKASQASITALSTRMTNEILGVGHDPAVDSQKAISDRTFFGGAVC